MNPYAAESGRNFRLIVVVPKFREITAVCDGSNFPFVALKVSSPLRHLSDRYRDQNLECGLLNCCLPISWALHLWSIGHGQSSACCLVHCSLLRGWLIVKQHDLIVQYYLQFAMRKTLEWPTYVKYRMAISQISCPNHKIANKT
ncbi:hypothetical protein RF11_02916 [Thelohanellus kitauei]|uniref:Uncharacterized protein n=1 Tax=Thelohanellus kitauei TaxID=669202 RepID=A0A0C2NBN7_THEKT|nr:hypothetical protein RF11_02916 [Thelohanellus kitauei]